MGLSNTGLILEGADDVVGLNKNGDETLLGEVARRVDQHGALHALDEVHHLHVPDTERGAISQGQLHTSDPGDSGEGKAEEIRRGYPSVQAQQPHRLRTEGESESFRMVYQSACHEKGAEERQNFIRRDINAVSNAWFFILNMEKGCRGRPNSNLPWQ